MSRERELQAVCPTPAPRQRWGEGVARARLLRARCPLCTEARGPQAHMRGWHLTPKGEVVNRAHGLQPVSSPPSGGHCGGRVPSLLNFISRRKMRRCPPRQTASWPRVHTTTPAVLSGQIHGPLRHRGRPLVGKPRCHQHRANYKAPASRHIQHLEATTEAAPGTRAPRRPRTHGQGPHRAPRNKS